ncbi:hypothetical protein A9R05_42950 (plasmid) [Burkholderia sp. KK1]|uniref:Uncharacterized protein n=1 Tax=Burkholderia sp. M701 TaxID=326454 RepID=V5YP24_9BURK|nr:hypothetical protein [Burkholderia sp. M701]AQH05779.1 hypothetical protein A9R05_42950 [Burkholderia sp. KK1]BAO19004.1 hypothetical protein [Burkholderia sp. M701]
MRNAINTMLCWNPGTSEIALVPWPDVDRCSQGFTRTALACTSSVHKMTVAERTAIVYIEAIHLIVRDKCDPAAVHAALLGLSEYVGALAEDMPGMPIGCPASEQDSAVIDEPPLVI